MAEARVWCSVMPRLLAGKNVLLHKYGARAQLNMSVAKDVDATLCWWQCRQICAHLLPTQTQGLQLSGGRPEPGADPPAQLNVEVRQPVCHGVLAYELAKAWDWKRQLPMHTLPHQQNANGM